MCQSPARSSGTKPTNVLESTLKPSWKAFGETLGRPVLTHFMKAPPLLVTLVALLAGACRSGPAPDNSVSLAQAKEYFARIRPGMTLEEVRQAVPHVSERVLMLNHGGLDYLLELSHEYRVVLRVSHSGKHGPSDYEQNHLDLHSQQAVLGDYGHNLINAAPSLQGPKGRIILRSDQPW